MSDVTDVISTAPFLPLSNSRSFLCRELSQLTAVICGLFGRVIIMKIMSLPGRKCMKSIDGAHRSQMSIVLTLVSEAALQIDAVCVHEWILLVGREVRPPAA